MLFFAATREPATLHLALASGAEATNVAPISAVPATHLLPAAASARPGGFRLFLSELNPLQYIPVIGTLYRALTHDTIPETAREAGSLVVSFLTGGPIGAAINLGALAAEKATGIDPEKLGDQALASVGIGAGKASVTVVESPVPGPAVAAPTAAGVPRGAWSASQLAAYGITRTRGNELQRGDLRGSDVLNDLELARQKSATVA